MFLIFMDVLSKAHLTRTLQGTPSIFQVTAQDALGGTVKPALRKIVEYLSAAYPDRLGSCLRWYDELYLLLDCCLQYHYLKHYAASFSESFYGLHRVTMAVSPEFHPSGRLSPALERASLAVLVLLPYLGDKAQQYTDAWRARDEDGQLGKSSGAVCRRMLHRAHSALHLVWGTATLVQLAAYVSGKASAHCPQLQVLGLALRDAPPQAADIGSATVGGALLRAAEYCAFLVQFLRWWEAVGAPPPAPPPPPPPPPQPLHRRNVCPLCLQRWRTPAVLPVSGLVYCYTCVSRALRERPVCPRTGLPASQRDLVRLYL